MANRSLLDHALGWLARGGIRRAAVVVPGELAEQGRAAAAGAPAETLDGFLGGEPFVLHLVDSVAKRGFARSPADPGGAARPRCSWRTLTGPTYTSIGDDVVIEGAEIEHSVILPGACISHLGARLEASVIGPRSKVFRDFRLPRAFRLTLGEGAEVSLT